MADRKVNIRLYDAKGREVERTTMRKSGHIVLETVDGKDKAIFFFSDLFLLFSILRKR
jgi:hypothetical protein